MKFSKSDDKQTKQFLMRLTEAEFDALKELAEEHADGNVSGFIRKAIDHYQEHPPKPQRKSK